MVCPVLLALIGSHSTRFGIRILLFVMLPQRRNVLSAAMLVGFAPLLQAFGPIGNPEATSRLDIAPGPISGVFPLQNVSGKRYLIDASGRPFMFQGDAAWSLLVRLSREQAVDYLDDRQKRGFNTVLVNLIEHEFADEPPKNRYGESPFRTAGNFGLPSEPYFSHCDFVIRKAAERGILVILAPAYMGFGGGSQGWYREMQNNGPDKLRAFGQYVARRFRQHANILWLHGGDFDPPERTLLLALVGGIRNEDMTSLHTFHGARGTSSTDFLGTSEAWLTVNTIYSDATNVVNKAFREYSRSQKPFFLVEGRYEGDNGADGRTVRMQAYQTLLSGGCGHVMGNGEIWQFRRGWERALASEGASTIGYLRSLLEIHAWTKLVPDPEKSFLTGEIRDGADRTAAALAADGTFGIIYSPSPRNLSVNLSRMAGHRITARWYDPSSGRFLEASGSPFPASASRVFVQERKNASGHGDWVLLLQTAK